MLSDEPVETATDQLLTNASMAGAKAKISQFPKLEIFENTCPS
jgi:Pyruvate/2-oxoacid:ferredoxin oxidoreductase gamma subunit